MAKTWIEKFESAKAPVVKRLEFPFAGIPANSRMLISCPKDIDAYIRTIPRGRVIPIETLRRDLALAEHADYTCPVTTGIFLRVVSEVAFEKYQDKKKANDVTPFWRVVDPDSALAGKLRCGKKFIIQHREREEIAG